MEPQRARDDIAGAPADRPTHALASWAHGLTYDDIEPRVRERAKDLLIDAIACALAADRAEEMAGVERFAGDLAGHGGSSTVIGSSTRAMPGPAALLNAYRITALTSCDVHTATHFHVTPEVVPPALAVAERDGRSGSDLLVALAAGCEVATRVATGLDYPVFRARGWHTPGVAGPFGGAVAAGRLLGLDPAGLRNAMGLAGSQAAGTWASWGTPTVKFHQARGALAALMSALLAATGFTSAEEILVAPDGGILPAYAGGGRPEAMVRSLGTDWELERISLRPWPGGTPLQPVITALMDLAAAGRLPAPSASARVFVNPGVYRQHAGFRDPAGTFQAMLSIHHATAAIMVRGRLGFDEFMREAYTDPLIRSVRHDRVEVIADPELEPVAARVVLDGVPDAPFTAGVSVPRGHPDDPADRPLLAAKFMSCAVPVLGDTAARELFARLADLEAVTDVRALCELLRPQAPGSGAGSARTRPR